jgi:hypothetical protein
MFQTRKTSCHYSSQGDQNQVQLLLALQQKTCQAAAARVTESLHSHLALVSAQDGSICPLFVLNPPAILLVPGRVGLVFAVTKDEKWLLNNAAVPFILRPDGESQISSCWRSLRPRNHARAVSSRTWRDRGIRDLEIV